LLALQKSLFGWVVAGSHRANQLRESYGYQAQSLSAIDTYLLRLWEVEKMSTSAKRLMPEHKLCEEHFKPTTRLEENEVAI